MTKKIVFEYIDGMMEYENFCKQLYDDIIAATFTSKSVPLLGTTYRIPEDVTKGTALKVVVAATKYDSFNTVIGDYHDNDDTVIRAFENVYYDDYDATKPYLQIVPLVYLAHSAVLGDGEYMDMFSVMYHRLYKERHVIKGKELYKF